MNQKPLNASAAKTPHLNLTVHTGIMCDACSTKPITGTRYKCVRCPDYDLCGACFDLGTRHPHGFVNVQIPKHPDRVKPPTGATLTHLGVICDGCKAFVKGIRYKCGNCLNFDLCAACEENMNHDPTHIFLKIRKPIAWSPMDHLLPSLYDPKPPLKVVYGKDNLSFVRAYTSLQEKGTDVSVESKRNEKTELQTSMPECQAIDLMADKVPEPILAEAMDCREAPPAHEGEGHVPKSTATEGRSLCMKQDDEPEIVSSAECSAESSEDERSNDVISTVGEPTPDRTRKEMLQAIGKTQLPRCPTDDGDGDDNSSDTSESSESSTTEEESSESGDIVGTAYASEILEGPLGSIVVKPRQPIKKSWIVKNTGTCTWPCNSPLVLVAGDLTAGRPVLVKKMVRPGERVRIDMTFRAPKQIGTYSSYYRLCAPYSSNFVFGTYLECRFTVCDTEQSNLRSSEENKSSSPSSTDSRASSVPMDSASSSTVTGTILMEDSCTIEFPSPACSWPYSDSDNDQSDPPVSNGHESDDDETMEIVSVSSRDSRSVE